MKIPTWDPFIGFVPTLINTPIFSSLIAGVPVQGQNHVSAGQRDARFNARQGAQDEIVPAAVDQTDIEGSSRLHPSPLPYNSHRCTGDRELEVPDPPNGITDAVVLSARDFHVELHAGLRKVPH